MAAAEVVAADASGLGRAGLGVSASGSGVAAVGDQLGAFSPDAAVWTGEAAAAFGGAVRRRAWSAGMIGRVGLSAGVAVAEYARVVADAQSVAAQGERMRVVGEREMVRGRRAYGIAARFGDAGAARQAISLFRQASASRLAGVALGEQAVRVVADAAERVIAALRAARVAVEEATAGERDGEHRDVGGWSWSDLLLAPVTIPAGLVNGAVVQPLVGLSKLAAAGLVAEWELVNDPEGLKRLARWAPVGPGGLLMAVGGEDLLGDAIGFGVEQAQQYAQAARDDGASGAGRELAGDALAAAGLAGRVIDEVTGTRQIREGLAEGDLFTSASGTGALVDLLVGSHEIGSLGDAGRFVDDAGDIARVGSGDELRLDLDLPGGAGATNNTYHEFALDDPILDTITGGARDHTLLPRPWAVETADDPYTGVVRIDTNMYRASGYIYKIDPENGTTTIALNAHLAYDKSRFFSEGVVAPEEITQLRLAVPGEQQYVDIDLGPGNIRYRTAHHPGWPAVEGGYRISVHDIAVLEMKYVPEGAHAFTLAESAPLFTPDQQFYTAGYPGKAVSDMVRTTTPGIQHDRARGMTADRGYRIGYTPFTSASHVPNPEVYSMPSRAGLSGSPIWYTAPDGSIQVGGMIASGAGGPLGLMPSDTSWDDMQGLADLTSPTGNPGTLGNYGGDATGPDLDDATRRWMLAPENWWSEHW